jgi:hypothetical protein
MNNKAETSPKEKKKKPKPTKEEKHQRLIKEVYHLATKLKENSPTYEEGAYWERLELDCKAALARPLG